MKCRAGCGACCIAPSISSSIPGMPHGKPSGIRCIQLSHDNRCLLFGKPERPKVCCGLQPSEELCGKTAEEALEYLQYLEEVTSP
ncbi:MAG: YkgJ family cysteine cluster protein [Clostridiaceae bacterium]